jgi:PTH1 family peptidyl-tRNA hydrolase
MIFSFIKTLLGFGSKTEKIDTSMKYLIAGLGNIGAEYDDTRHNIGFEILDRLARKADVSFKNDTLGSVAEIKHKGRTFILLKPSTYMNLSGKAVRYWLQKEKIEPENLLVVLDDLQLPFGKQRLRPKGSDGGHNGLKSIDQLLGSNVYARLRIGIGDDFKAGKQVNYVLGKWTNKEHLELPDITLHAMDTILSFGAIGLELTMTTYNKERKK